MTDIGSIIQGIFGPLGPYGGLLCIFLLFFLDAVMIPTLPELFTVLIFTTDYGVNEVEYGLAILLVLSLAEIAGVLTLYLIVKKAGVPKILEKAVTKYRDFLFFSDERMILMNRVAPILPFLGAFIAICGWDIKKSLFNVVIGGIAKFGVILLLSGVFLAFFSDRGKLN